MCVVLNRFVSKIDFAPDHLSAELSARRESQETAMSEHFFETNSGLI